MPASVARMVTVQQGANAGREAAQPRPVEQALQPLPPTAGREGVRRGHLTSVRTDD